MMRRTTPWVGIFLLATGLTAVAQDRDTLVRRDRDEVGARADWVYNDLPAGVAEAKKTNQPLLIIIRCIP